MNPAPNYSFKWKRYGKMADYIYSSYPGRKAPSWVVFLSLLYVVRGIIKTILNLKVLVPFFLTYFFISIFCLTPFRCIFEPAYVSSNKPRWRRKDLTVAALNNWKSFEYSGKVFRKVLKRARVLCFHKFAVYNLDNN